MHDQRDSGPFSMTLVKPQLDPGSFLRAQRALHSCGTVPELAQTCVTAALRVTGFDFALLLLGRPGAWVVTACDGAAVACGVQADVDAALVRRLAEQGALELEGVDAVLLLGALLPVPHARRVFVHPITSADAPSDPAELCGALVCGYVQDDAFGDARRQALDLIAATTACEFERLWLADELDQHAAALQRQERLLAALSAIGEVSRARGRRARRLLRLALRRVLAALDLVDGGIYRYDYQARDLVLVAAHPPDGVVARQGRRLSFAEHAESIPVRAALLVGATGQEQGVGVGGWGLGVGGHESGIGDQGDQATKPQPCSPDLSSLALPLLAGARLIGVVQVAGRALNEDGRITLRALAKRLALAVEHVQLFDAARLEQVRARALVDASNDAIMLLDSDGCAIMFNRRAKYYFGLAERDVIGRSAAELRAMFQLIFEDGAAFDAWLAPLLAAPDRRAVAEFKVLRAEPRLLQCYTAPVLDQQEYLFGRLLVFRDITREREVELLKNEFVSMVSHELRTPLTSIRGALQLVVGRPQEPELPARTRELLTVSLNNSERLIRLVNDILDISKIEHGAIQLRLAAVDPAELCNTAAQEVATFASSRDITLDVLIAPGVPAVSADRDRALQVLTNLLSNAVKFSDPGQPVELSAVAGEGVMRFAVRDHGRGIALEDHQRIFEKFQQADNSLTRDVGGTGLGLAICKALVEEHGGRIWLDSTPGHGSTFSFTLPLAASAEQDSAPHQPAEQPARDLRAAVPAPGRVLVVEGDHHVRPTLVRLLERAGFRVAGVADGQTALEMLRRDPPDLILLDVHMPGIDGYEVLRRLKGDPDQRQLPVVILTALDLGDDGRRRALDLGVAHYLEKPIASETLLAVITSILQPSAGIR